jgi:acetyl esterase/lipase
MKKIFFTFCVLCISMISYSQKTIPLYTGAIPNSKPVKDAEHSEINDGILIISNVTRPTLSIYLPPKDKADGSAVIVIPGGGYHIVAGGHEGTDVAKRLNEAGITAFVVKYRIPNDSTMVNKEIGPLQDAQRAIQIVREHAKEWGLNPGKIGIMGFSAGGHLASTAGTHYQKAVIPNPNHINLRPDFMILVYPVISFTDSIGHIGSRDNLLGKNPSPEKIKYYSNELQVNAQTPPSFLVHAKDDDAVPVQNSIAFYNALKKNKVETSIYLYEKGGHGFGLNNSTSQVPWIAMVIDWIKKR